MKLPSPEEIAQIKATAVAKFGHDRVALVDLDAPIDAAVVVAHFNFAGWSQQVDAEKRDLDTAHQQGVVGQLLWPALDDFLALQRKWPLLSKNVMSHLYTRAGVKPGRAKASRFTIDSHVGVDDATAKTLIEQNAGTDLWGFILPTGQTVIMRAPLADVLLAARAADSAARERADGITRAALPFVKEAIVHATEPIDALLERLPATVEDLRVAFLQMGGDGVASRSKSL